MIYLQQLCKTISNTELNLLKEAGFKGLEAKVFAYILKQADSFTVAEAAAELGLSEVHFRKTHSSLLHKTYNILAPEGGLKLLQFLARRNVHNQVKHELGKLEKKLLAENNAAELERLFYNAAELFLNMDLSVYDIDYLNTIVEKYKLYGKNEAFYKQLIPELHVLFYQQSVFSRKYASTDQKRIDFFKSVPEKTAYFKKHLIGSGDNWAEFWFYNHLAHYYEQSDREDIEKRRESLILSIATIEKEAEIFPIEYKILSNLNLAMSYYDSSEYLAAEKIFNNIFQLYPEKLRGSIFYVDSFIQLLIAIGENKRAQEKLFYYYAYNADKPYVYEGNNFAPLSILGLTYLLDNDFEKGYKCVQRAQQLCVKSSFYYIESMIRILENSYFFLVGEYDTAEQLTTKNIKYHQYKKNGEEGDFFIGFHKLIPAFIKYKFENKLPNKNYEHLYRAWQEGEFRFLGVLLEKMKLQVGLKNWPK